MKVEDGMSKSLKRKVGAEAEGKLKKNGGGWLDKCVE
jgi:hypothetical protein